MIHAPSLRVPRPAMVGPVPRARTYPGHAGVLLHAPYVTELRDPAAQGRWFDVYDFGVADGINIGISQERARQEASQRAQWEVDEQVRQWVARGDWIPYDALCELRGEPARAQAPRDYWQQVGIDRSPYQEKFGRAIRGE